MLTDLPLMINNYDVHGMGKAHKVKKKDSSGNIGGGGFSTFAGEIRVAPTFEDWQNLGPPTCIIVQKPFLHMLFCLI